jgi:hypothetical protein
VQFQFCRWQQWRQQYCLHREVDRVRQQHLVVHLSATYARIVLGVSDLAILNTGNPAFSLGVSKTGQLATGSITQSNPSITIAVTTVTNGSITNGTGGGLLWDQSTQDPAHGSFTVNLTSVSLGSDGYTFTIHGTADGTLTASAVTPGATGIVTFHVDF